MTIQAPPPKRLLWPDEVTNPADLGGKARSLWRLGKAGFPIPPWFVVPPATLLAELGPVPSDAWPAGVRELSPSPQLLTEVLAGLQSLCAQGEPVALRSSGSDEDGAGHSFAGQFESVLWVDPRSPRAVTAALLTVWRSGFSERVIVYRMKHGLPATPAPPTVLVQRMVNATSAGVAFSADPISGRRAIAVVSSVFGLGSALVNGETDADTFRVDLDSKIVERTIATKRCAHRPTGRDGVEAVALPEDQSSVPSISDAQAIAIAALARRSARFFERAQDIEWAIENNSIYLLQSRPITSLAGLPDPEGERLVWDNSNIAESYAGVTTPLTFSFARYVYEHVYRQFCRLMRVREDIIADHATMFANMLGIARGRVYYNLINWYKLLSLLPGFALNRRFMEQMMGVNEGLPEEIVAQLQSATLGAKVQDASRLAATLAGLVVRNWTLSRDVKRFYVRLNEALAEPTPPLRDMRLDQLASHFHGLERRLLTRWDAPLVNDFFAMIFYGTLRKLTIKWCQDIDGTLQNDLVCGQGDIISAEPPRRLREMARRVVALSAKHPDLVNLLCQGEEAAILAQVEKLPELAALYHAYIARFGDRCLEELKLESHTLHDDATPVFRSVGQIARRLAQPGAATPAEDETRRQKLRSDAQLRVSQSMRGHPIRAILFSWVLAQARQRVRDRENLRFERTRLFGRVRLIFLEAGRRFFEVGLLDDPRDVFYLHIEDVLGFIEGTATTVDLRGLVDVRKADFERFRADPALTPDGRFETRGAVNLGHRFRGAAAPIHVEETPGAAVRKGIGCCPGVVRGKARVILDPRGAELAAGEVLVASRTDPGWVLLFPAALGVLVEHGSLLSHSAIVARELGIPAVVSVPGLIDWLHSGDLVELDGATGSVRLLDPVSSSGESS